MVVGLYTLTERFTKMPDIESFVLDAKRKATSTDTFVVTLGRWKPGMILVITAVSVTNETTASKTADIGVRRYEGDLYDETLLLTTAGVYYVSPRKIYVPSDCNVIVRLNSPSSGDVYVINLFAHLISSTTLKSSLANMLAEVAMSVPA